MVNRPMGGSCQASTRPIYVSIRMQRWGVDMGMLLGRSALDDTHEEMRRALDTKEDKHKQRECRSSTLFAFKQELSN